MEVFVSLISNITLTLFLHGLNNYIVTRVSVSTGKLTYRDKSNHEYFNLTVENAAINHRILVNMELELYLSLNLNLP